MRSSVLVVLFVLVSGLFREAKADCHFSGSLGFGYAAASEHEALHQEESVELLGVGTCPLSFLGRSEAYLELGLGVNTDGHFTAPLGLGVLHEVGHGFALGLGGSLYTALQHEFVASLLVGPVFQLELVKHAGPLGHLSAVFVPGFIRHFSPEGPSYGGGASLAFEFTPGESESEELALK